MLNENGTFVRKLVYLPKYLADSIEVSKGWYDADAAENMDFSDCWNDEPLTFGYGVQVCGTAGANVKATFSGEVKKFATVTDVENYMAIANCSPADIKLGEIVVNCDDIGDGDGSGWQPLADYICILNENGTFVRKLVYLPKYLADSIEVSKGWYDADAAEDMDFSDCWNNKVTYAPGEGFQMCATAGAGATVTIKTALPVIAE